MEREGREGERGREREREGEIPLIPLVKKLPESKKRLSILHHMCMEAPPPSAGHRFSHSEEIWPSQSVWKEFKTAARFAQRRPHYSAKTWKHCTAQLHRGFLLHVPERRVTGPYMHVHAHASIHVTCTYTCN